MISKQHINEIKNIKQKKNIKNLIPVMIFLICFVLSIRLEITYSSETSLINDKLIDVCSIFFGIFIGSIYLFNKFKNQDTYNKFLGFCKILISLNLLIISMSFIIIVLHESIENYNGIILIFEEYLSLKTSLNNLIYSFYLGLFGVTINYIYRYLAAINIILQNKE